jgi:hypothetical protein
MGPVEIGVVEDDEKNLAEREIEPPSLRDVGVDPRPSRPLREDE